MRLLSGLVALGLLLTLGLAVSPDARTVAAATLVSTLPEFNGTGHNIGDPYPLPAVTVGTFTYSIPLGDTLASATISGQFGNTQSSSTAGVDLYLDGILVARCVRLTACWTGPQMPWSHTFTAEELSVLRDGSATLTAIQTSESVIRLGPTTLTIETVAPTPVPTRTPHPNISGAIGGVAEAAAQQARENRERANAAAQVPSGGQAVSPPSTGQGFSITPPSTGDAGLMKSSSLPASYAFAVGALAAVALAVSLRAYRAR